MDRHTLKQLENQVGELLLHGSPSCIRQAHSIMTENFESILYFTLTLTEPKPKPAHTIADNYPAGGLTSTEPCMFCEDYNDLESKYGTLQASHTKLKREVNASNNRLKTVFPVLPEDYRKSVEVQMRFNEQAISEAEKISEETK